MFKKKYFLSYFLVLQIIFLQIMPYFSSFIEKYYSNGLYPKIAWFSRVLWGWIPFSIGDCLYFTLIILGFRWFWKKRGTWKINWKDNSLGIINFFSVFYFLFYTLWALNYYREPLFEKMNIQQEYSDEDLLHFTKKLISKTNEIQFQITKNDSLIVKIPYSQEKIFQLNLNGYKKLAKQYSFFTYSNLSIKNSLFSLPLTYMGFGGYLNPFTNEAQVNKLFPMYNFPITSSHEMAHQMGFANESECNFIGFLASTNNDNLYCKYSGYSFALRYCLGIWQIKNPDIFNQIIKTVHLGILKNYQENQDFWKEYETPIETGFKVFYDNYLKINQQKDGLNSYSKFIDLMVSYYETREL